MDNDLIEVLREIRASLRTIAGSSIFACMMLYFLMLSSCARH